MSNIAFHLPRRNLPPPPATRLARVGSALILVSLLVAICTEGGGFLRRLCSLDTYFAYGDDGPFGVWTEIYKTSTVDYYDRAAQALPITVPDNSILFILPMLECPDLAHQGVKEDAPPNEMFYDMISVMKHNLCGEISITGPGGPVTYTPLLQAIIPGDAAECMGPNGEPYDRIKVLEDLTIGVKLLGSPVDKENITSDYLRENVDNDVGIKDLIKLRPMGMTDFPVVVVVDYTVLKMKPLDPVIEAFVNSDAPIAYSMDYSPPNVPPTATNRGVNTGFMLIKPNVQELDDIANVYETTEYSPTTGWGNSGIGGFPGAMGSSGILTYYYSVTKPTPAPMLLDKCVFNNDYEYHLDGNGVCRDGSNGNCPSCQATPAEDVVVSRLNNKVCGKPFECPDLSSLAGTSCEAFHKKWFQDRVDYEDNNLKGGPRAARTGTYQSDISQGYCEAAGGYEKILPDSESGPLPIPEPETQSPGCQTTCPAGQYLKQDCTCSSDECDACPEGTRCQKKGNGVPALCIDCECGFCDFAGNACCDFNGVNNCKSATNKKECLLQNAYYPGWPGTGNACSGVEISATAVPNGCGCQPNELTPCTYDSTGNADKCFIVTAHELLASHPEKSAVADACKACVDQCDPCVSGKGQDDVNDMMNCLGKTIGKKREACRSGCSSVCKH